MTTVGVYITLIPPALSFTSSNAYVMIRVKPRIPLVAIASIPLVWRCRSSAERKCLVLQSYLIIIGRGWRCGQTARTLHCMMSIYMLMHHCCCSRAVADTAARELLLTRARLTQCPSFCLVEKVLVKISFQLLQAAVCWIFAGWQLLTRDSTLHQWVCMWFPFFYSYSYFLISFYLSIISSSTERFVYSTPYIPSGRTQGELQEQYMHMTGSS